MYIVIEIQKGSTLSAIVSTYNTRNEAEQQYHTILAYAAVSSVPMHSAVMLEEDGRYIKSESFDHEEE